MCPANFEIQGVKMLLKIFEQVLTNESQLKVCLN